ncbi:uncharacterized protein LOC106763689 [Vigna radiata var. radiata]|uniref:Uncharacterized protein LOC106763689 n=1 Tax=Vigna radiata var. radiata TaxID=3916 RepID=A0A1S3UBE0_VIGRR|nr:uncharacterized protein LOC106763689 [Vigna radiata var. radiata]
MAGDLPLQLLQEMQRQMQEMRAEIAAMRADRVNEEGGPSIQSVNVETLNSESDEGDNQLTQGLGIRGDQNPAIGVRGGRANGRGRGRGERGRGRGRGRGRRGDPDNFDEVIHNDGERQNELGERNHVLNDQAEGFHPFTPQVMRAIIPGNKMIPPLDKYGGSSDPVKHLRSFVDAMAVYSTDELVWCRVFALSLKEEALDWFHSLPPATIDSFTTLRQMFSQQYASSKTPRVTYTALVRMRQGMDEPFKMFMDRFNRTASQVRNADQRLIVGALTAALRPRPFCDYMHAEEPRSMDELQNRLASFIQIEEGRAQQRGREEGEPSVRMNRERGVRQTFGRAYRRVDHRRGDQTRAQQYAHHTPLNAPRVRVLEEALRADLMTVTQASSPPGADESKYCRYHQNRGHTTEDCVTLKDKLETLVQAGHLQRFVQRHRGTSSSRAGRLNTRNDPPKKNYHQRRDRSRSRSQDRMVRGVINTILGGFAGGGSTLAARKRHLRSLHSVSRTGEPKWSMPSITFSDQDFHAPDLEQDDLMVITTMIARIHKGKGGYKGYVDLRTSLGTDKKAREIKVCFFLVEVETSYNVLLGRPCLNVFGAIVSTPHLTLKYPTDDGVVHTVRADQKMARECYAGGLKVKPRASELSCNKSEVAMMELDPRSPLEERVEPMGDVWPFGN